MQNDINRVIFIIDDSPNDIELTAIALESMRQGISISSALDGKSALAMLRNAYELPALILLDIKMPGMDGIEVLREIRADRRLREIPVIIVTSSALEQDKSAAMAAGANSYIRKPLALNQFSKDLNSILNRWIPNMLGPMLKVPASISHSLLRIIRDSYGIKCWNSFKYFRVLILMAGST